MDENVALGISFWIAIRNMVLFRLFSSYRPKYTADLQNVPLIASPKIISLRSGNLAKLGYKHESSWQTHVKSGPVISGHNTGCVRETRVFV